MPSRKINRNRKNKLNFPSKSELYSFRNFSSINWQNELTNFRLRLPWAKLAIMSSKSKRFFVLSPTSKNKENCLWPFLSWENEVRSPKWKQKASSRRNTKTFRKTFLVRWWNRIKKSWNLGQSINCYPFKLPLTFDVILNRSSSKIWVNITRVLKTAIQNKAQHKRIID